MVLVLVLALAEMDLIEMACLVVCCMCVCVYCRYRQAVGNLCVIEARVAKEKT